MKKRPERCRLINEDRLWISAKEVYDFSISSNLSDLEAAIYVQNRYYFGAINELLAIDKPIPTSEFVKQRASQDWVICTKKLNGYISSWAAYVNSLPEADRTQHLGKTKAYIETMVKKRWHKDRHYVLQVSASVEVLGRTLQAAMIWYWNVLPDVTLRLTDHISLLEDAGWCGTTVLRAWSYVFPLTLYAASTMAPSSSRYRDHTKCSRTICEAFTISDENTYETKHTPDCSGTCGQAKVIQRNLHDTIMQGRIPIITLSLGSDGKLSTEVTHSGDVSHYIAISHVWSHGLGNLHENSLPYCQLWKIYNMLEDWPVRYAKPDWFKSLLNPIDIIQTLMESNKVDSLLLQQVEKLRKAIAPVAEEYIDNWLDTLKKSAQDGKVNIWIDTLCIPHIPESRKTAITQINDVYAGSFYTVALDADLESMLDTASISEIFLRLQLSSWKSRCWTFLEGEVSMYHLRLKVGSRLLDLFEMFEFDESHLSLSYHVGRLLAINNWLKLHGYGQVHGFRGWDTKKYLVPGPMDEDKLFDLFGQFVTFTRSAPMKELMTKWETSSQKRYTKSFCLLKYFKSRISDEYFKSSIRIADNPWNLLRIWNELALRSAARTSDRLLIFISALDMANNTSILDEVVLLRREERMEAWIRKQHVIPSNFLFLQAPHLTTPGLRWAPRDVYPEKIRGKDNELITRSPNELELRVRKSGFLLTLRETVDLNTAGGITFWVLRDTSSTYILERVKDPNGQPKPPLEFSKGDRVGLIFARPLVRGLVESVALVAVHASSSNDIRATFKDVASIQLRGEELNNNASKHPSQLSKFSKLVDRVWPFEGTHSTYATLWDFELVEREWIID